MRSRARETNKVLMFIRQKLLDLAGGKPGKVPLKKGAQSLPPEDFTDILQSLERLTGRTIDKNAANFTPDQIKANREQIIEQFMAMLGFTNNTRARNMAQEFQARPPSGLREIHKTKDDLGFLLDELMLDINVGQKHNALEHAFEIMQRGGSQN